MGWISAIGLVTITVKIHKILVGRACVVQKVVNDCRNELRLTRTSYDAISSVQMPELKKTNASQIATKR